MYAKLAIVNRIRPPSGPPIAIGDVGPTHSGVNSSSSRRRPPRSDRAPRIGDTIALMPTLTEDRKAEHELAGRRPELLRPHQPQPHRVRDDREREDRVGEVVQRPGQPGDGPQVDLEGRSIGEVDEGGRGRHRASCSEPGTGRRPAHGSTDHRRRGAPEGRPRRGSRGTLASHMATETPYDVAAAWQPQRPGRRGPRGTSRTRSWSPSRAGCASSRRSPRTRSRRAATAAGARPRRAAPGAARRVRGRRGGDRGPCHDGGAALLDRRLPVDASRRAAADPRPARSARTSRTTRSSGRATTSRPRRALGAAVREALERGERRVRRDRPPVGRRQLPRRRAAARAPPDPRGRPVRVVPRPDLRDRAAVGGADARDVGCARLPRPLVPGRELALPGRPGAADWAVAQAPDTPAGVPKPVAPR